MKKGAFIVVPGLIFLLCFSCKEKSADPEQKGPSSFTFQSSKCLKNQLLKSSIGDSVFLYRFTDTLTIDFSVIANCCPDSNRFVVSSITGVDTIVVMVADTARSLCNCDCPYMIHAEFVNLPNDHYMVRCTLGRTQDQGEQIHLVDLYRSR